jgi:glycerol-3-phosphate O-acyltransferase
VDFRTMPADARHVEVERLGTRLMDSVGRVVPALPVSLVATALLRADGVPLSMFDLKIRVARLIDELERSGAYVHIPRADRDYAIEVGLRMLKLRHLAIEEEGGFRAEPRELLLLNYYANAIAHLLPAEERADRPALVAAQ